MKTWWNQRQTKIIVFELVSIGCSNGYFCLWKFVLELVIIVEAKLTSVFEDTGTQWLFQWEK
jgi:hypothetical protein